MLRKSLLTSIFFLFVFVLSNYAQRSGDLYFGLKGGYVSSYKDALFGAQASYCVTDPLELSLSFLTNPSIKLDEGAASSKVGIYSMNVDMNYYVLLQRTWAMGPSLGGQYMRVNQKFDTSGIEDSGDEFGFNLGWYMRYNWTENLNLNGGWRYSFMTHDSGYHLFYIGLGYAFNVF